MSTSKHTLQRPWLRIFIMVLLIGLLWPSGSVSAQTPNPYEKRLPLNGLRSSVPLHGDELQSANVINVVTDPSFEASYNSTLYWYQDSLSYGTPLCTTIDCGTGNGTAGPRTGSVWAWFGGTGYYESAVISQTLTMPSSCTATLQFYFRIGYAGANSDATDIFLASIDGSQVFYANATQKSQYPSYTLVTVDVSTYANGASHTLAFNSYTGGGETDADLVTFNLDDVSLVVSGDNCIKGNVGAPGAVLSYTDGTAQTTLSGGDGSYSLSISNNWSGTVTPSHPCFTFSPVSRSYNNVITNLTGQNYTATFNNAPICAVTVGVFRPGNGALYLKNSNTTGYADTQINYGLGGDYPITGDWDGDGDATIGIYRNGSFYLRNSNTIGFADIVFPFGMSGDQPVTGDWDGDGIDTIGIYRNGIFYLRNSNTAGMPEMAFALGVPGDVGIAGDWTGKGFDTTGVFRPSNGALYLKNKNETGYADIQINYGLPGDKPVTGDWNNDGTDTIGIYRNGSFYLRNSNTIGFADIVFALGVNGDMPIAGNWDGAP